VAMRSAESWEHLSTQTAAPGKLKKSKTAGIGALRFRV
jgi:hypothetical protein